MSDGIDHSEALELLEDAQEHEKEAAEHEAQADRLTADAVEAVQETLSEALADELVINVEAELNEDPYFVVTVYNEPIEETIEETVSMDVSLFRAQQFMIGNVSKTEEDRQRERIQNIKGIIADLEENYDEGAPVKQVLQRARTLGIKPDQAEHELRGLKQKGEVYEPRTDHVRTT